jgi:hypothetical protein
MKAQIKINSSYGFDHNWTLEVTTSKGTKAFYLGQDVKFCRRVLGMEPSEIVQQIGSNDVTEPKVNSRLAKFIIKSLGLSNKQLNTLQPWELSAE